MKQSHRAMKKEPSRGPPERRGVDSYYPTPMIIDPSMPGMSLAGASHDVVIIHQNFYKSKTTYHVAISRRVFASSNYAYISTAFTDDFDDDDLD